MFFSTKASVLALDLLISLASFATAADNLSGAAPGVNPAAVQNKAPNDSSYVDYNNFQDSIISTHNKWRREHRVSDVSWDPELAAYAETISRRCSMQHSYGPYGENFSAGYSTAQESVDTWGDERSTYHDSGDYDKPYPPWGSGHFTQLVWESSHTIGCARTKCAGVISADYESWFVVCEYAKRGNVEGQYTKNVFKPTPKNPGRRLGVQDDNQ